MACGPAPPGLPRRRSNARSAGLNPIIAFALIVNDIVEGNLGIDEIDKLNTFLVGSKAKHVLGETASIRFPSYEF
jgi:hypothetical protein